MRLRASNMPSWLLVVWSVKEGQTSSGQRSFAVLRRVSKEVRMHSANPPFHFGSAPGMRRPGMKRVTS
ncbi:hypothetical protein DAT35_01870 [Vitiosangium sp. GDMCC 1.1324]|nr:hypothetical protein DAT35_01870 [Vitiosangium sp. GDMCC 1.1324]